MRTGIFCVDLWCLLEELLESSTCSKEGITIDTVTMLILVIIHVSNPKIYIAGVLIAVAGASLATNILTQCLMDSLDYGEWKTGRKNTAVVMSAYGIGTKIGLAFGGSGTVKSYAQIYLQTPAE